MGLCWVGRTVHPKHERIWRRQRQAAAKPISLPRLDVLCRLESLARRPRAQLAVKLSLDPPPLPAASAHLTAPP